MWECMMIGKQVTTKTLSLLLETLPFWKILLFAFWTYIIPLLCITKENIRPCWIRGMTNIETNEHKSSTLFFPMVLEELQIPILQNTEKYIIEKKFIERTTIIYAKIYNCNRNWVMYPCKLIIVSFYTSQHWTLFFKQYLWYNLLLVGILLLVERSSWLWVEL